MVVTGFTKTVAAPGTPERMVSSSTPCNWFAIVAKAGNTGAVSVGGSNVHATNGPGVPLAAAGDKFPAMSSMETNSYDLYNLFVDAAVATNGVDVVYTVK